MCACIFLTCVGGRKKKVVGSGVGCVFQKALSAFGYSFMCNGIAAKFQKEVKKYLSACLMVKYHNANYEVSRNHTEKTQLAAVCLDHNNCIPHQNIYFIVPLAK